jgi:hypothetical protein
MEYPAMPRDGRLIEGIDERIGRSIICPQRTTQIKTELQWSSHLRRWLEANELFAIGVLVEAAQSFYCFQLQMPPDLHGQA